MNKIEIPEVINETCNNAFNRFIEGFHVDKSGFPGKTDSEISAILRKRDPDSTLICTFRK